jgi:hypothetical protein
LNLLEGVSSVDVHGEEFLLFWLLLIFEEFLEAAVGSAFYHLVQVLGGACPSAATFFGVLSPCKEQ